MVRLGESKETRCANLSFSAPGLTVADGCMDHKQASSVELLVSRIFGGRSHSTVRASSQFNTFINCHSQVIAPDQHPGLILPYFLLSARVKTFRPFAIPIRHIPTKKHSSHGTNLCRVYLEALPSILVLHLERFLYDVATEGITKASEPVQIAPELEIPHGMILFLSHPRSPGLTIPRVPIQISWHPYL